MTGPVERTYGGGGSHASAGNSQYDVLRFVGYDKFHPRYWDPEYQGRHHNSEGEPQ